MRKGAARDKLICQYKKKIDLGTLQSGANLAKLLRRFEICP